MIATPRWRTTFVVAALVAAGVGCRPAVRINGMAPVNGAETASASRSTAL